MIILAYSPWGALPLDLDRCDCHRPDPSNVFPINPLLSGHEHDPEEEAKSWVFHPKTRESASCLK